MIAALRRLPVTGVEACLAAALASLAVIVVMHWNARPLPLEALAALAAMGAVGLALALGRISKTPATDAASEALALVLEDEIPEALDAAAPNPEPVSEGPPPEIASLVRALRAAHAFEREAVTRISNGFDRLSIGIAEEAEKSATSSVGQAQLSMRLIEAIQNVTKRINDMYGSIGDLHATTQEMSRATDTFAQVSDSIAERARESKTIAGQTAETVSAAGDVVTSLQKATGRIGEVVTIINEITTKTHLLALNAGIEASRAGDAGRGFAVVASEVQKLAAQTQDATTQIRKHIDNVQTAVEAVVKKVEKSKQNIAEMGAVSDGVLETIEEQKDNIESILNAISAAVHGAREVHTAMEATKTDADVAAGLSDDVYMNSMTIESDADIMKSLLEGAVGSARTAALGAIAGQDGSFACRVAEGEDSRVVRVDDVSAVGARVVGAGSLRDRAAGSRLELHSYDFKARLMAVVCWPEEEGVRVRFETPASAEVLEAVCASGANVDVEDMAA